jgi:hypothetical protein
MPMWMRMSVRGGTHWVLRVSGAREGRKGKERARGRKRRLRVGTGEVGEGGRDEGPPQIWLGLRVRTVKNRGWSKEPEVQAVCRYRGQGCTSRFFNGV